MGGPPRDQQRDMRMIGLATGLAFSVIASLVICILGGLFLDQWTGTQPIFTLVGVFLGLATAGYFLYELASVNRPSGGPISRRFRDRGGPRPRNE